MPTPFDNAALTGIGSCGCNQSVHSPYALPSGDEPIVVSDPINDVHRINGVDVAVTDIWSNFDEFHVDENGFKSQLMMTTTAFEAISGSAGFTAILIANLTGTIAGQQALVGMADDPNYNNEQIAAFFNFGDLVSAKLYDYGDSEQFILNLPLEADHKFAVTMLSDLLAMSVEGGVAQSFVPTDVAPTTLWIQTQGTAHISFAGFYPAQDIADLPTLSAPS